MKSNEQSQDIFDAIKNGDVQEVKRLIEEEY